MPEAAKANEAESATETKVDPFANLPTTKLNGVAVPDFSAMDTSAARKYEKVNTAARESKMPIMANWKHGNAIFVPGRTVRENLRPGSVFATIVDIAKRAGRQGIASYEMASELRKAQLGNKRSHYCEKLPPVGWAEGYLNSAVTQGLIDIHGSRKADPLVAPQPAAEPAKS
jgi:hypothetical protein